MHIAAPENADAAQVREVSRVTWAGVVVNLVLAAVKTAGGAAAGSTVLLADAAHTVSDLATDCAILVGVRYWSAPADANHPHGHRIASAVKHRILGLQSDAAMETRPVDVMVHVEPGTPGDLPAPSPCGEATVDWKPKA